MASPCEIPSDQWCGGAPARRRSAHDRSCVRRGPAEPEWHRKPQSPADNSAGRERRLALARRSFLDAQISDPSPVGGAQRNEFVSGSRSSRRRRRDPPRWWIDHEEAFTAFALGFVATAILMVTGIVDVWAQ
jgi:hypothetical protein